MSEHDDATSCPACHERCTHPWHVIPDDDWLEEAAEEIVGATGLDGEIETRNAKGRTVGGVTAVLAILRKHRDGEASMDRPETGGSPPAAPRSGSTDRRGGR